MPQLHLWHAPPLSHACTPLRAGVGDHSSQPPSHGRPRRFCSRLCCSLPVATGYVDDTESQGCASAMRPEAHVHAQEAECCVRQPLWYCRGPRVHHNSAWVSPWRCYIPRVDHVPLTETRLVDWGPAACSSHTPPNPPRGLAAALKPCTHFLPAPAAATHYDLALRRWVQSRVAAAEAGPCRRLR